MHSIFKPCSDNLSLKVPSQARGYGRGSCRHGTASSCIENSLPCFSDEGVQTRGSPDSRDHQCGGEFLVARVSLRHPLEHGACQGQWGPRTAVVNQSIHIAGNYSKSKVFLFVSFVTNLKGKIVNLIRHLKVEIEIAFLHKA